MRTLTSRGARTLAGMWSFELSGRHERGFGREVLENLAPMALGGSGKLSFSQNGVAWTLSADNAFVN